MPSRPYSVIDQTTLDTVTFFLEVSNYGESIKPSDRIVI